MPTYEYECDKCGEGFEYFQSIKEAPKDVCEKCGGHLTKLLSAGTGLIFKGSGFYITDYKNSGGGDKAVSSTGGEKSEGKAAAGKADSKGGDSGSGSSGKSESKESKPASAPAPKAKES